MTHYLTKAETKRKKSRAGLAIGLAAVLFSFLVFGYVWQRIYLGQQLAAIEKMAAVNRDLEDEGKRLALHSQSANSWSEVERAAGERLGMTYPEKSQVVAAIMPPMPKGQGFGVLARSFFNPVNAAWSQQ